MLIVDEKVYLQKHGVRWRVLFVVGLAVTVIVGAANLLAWSYLQAYPINRGISRQLIERQTAPVDWLILGDSTCGQGIDPDVIEADTGGRALNLCTIANATVVNGVWQLQHYIERVGVPKKVVLFHAYHVWAREPRDLITMFDQIPLPPGFHKTMKPPIDLGWTGDLEVATRPLRTLMNMNLSIQYAVGREWDGLVSEKRVVRTEAAEDLNFIIRHKGFISTELANPEKVLEQSRQSAAAYTGREVTIAASNAAALRAACELSKKYGFELYLANSSISRVLYQDPGFQLYYSKLVERLSAIVDECPGAHYVLKVPAQFEPSEMDNEDHVVGEANATRLTRRLLGATVEAKALSGLR